MVTKLANGRGQLTLKGKEVTDEWEAMVKAAAKAADLSVVAWIVAVTTREACAEPVATETELLRREVAGFAQALDQLAARQKLVIARLDRLARRHRR